MKTVIEWIPLAERQPVQKQPCYCAANGWVLCGMVWWDGEGFRDQPFGGGRECRGDITHWSPAEGLRAD